MRKTLFVFEVLVLLAPISLFSGCPAPTATPKLEFWKRDFVFEYDQFVAVDFCASSANSKILVGQGLQESPNYPHDDTVGTFSGVVAKLNKFGTVEWRNPVTVGSGLARWCYDIEPTVNGSYLLSCASAINSTPYIVEIDDDGNFLRSVIVGSPTTLDIVERVLSVSGGNYLTVGETQAPNGIEDVRIGLLDQDLQPIWIRTFGNVEDQEWGISAAQDPEGNFIVIFIRKYKIAGSTLACLAKVSPEGIRLWQHDYPSGATSPGTSVIVCQNGDYIIPGSVDALQRVNQDGQILWHYRPEDYFHYDYDATNALELADQTILVSGGRTDGYAFLASVDSDGNERWIKWFSKSVGTFILSTNVDDEGVSGVGFRVIPYTHTDGSSTDYRNIGYAFHSDENGNFPEPPEFP